MSDEEPQTIPDPALDVPPPTGGSEGATDFWSDIDRSYDSEYRHHTRMSRLNQRNMSFAAQQFQSQLLGMMLLGEAEMPLTSDPTQPDPEPTQPDPTVQP